MRLAGRLQAGVVWVNEHMMMAEGMPWGGIKESGIGWENTPLGLEEYTQRKVVYVEMTDNKDRSW